MIEKILILIFVIDKIVALTPTKADDLIWTTIKKIISPLIDFLKKTKKK